MSTFTTSNLCCVVQQAVFCSLPRVGKRPFFGAHPLQAMDTPRTTNASGAHRFCIVVTTTTTKYCIFFSWGHGDHHVSDVFSVLSFYCA